MNKSLDDVYANLLYLYKECLIKSKEDNLVKLEKSIEELKKTAIVNLGHAETYLKYITKCYLK